MRIMFGKMFWEDSEIDKSTVVKCGDINVYRNIDDTIFIFSRWKA